MNFVILRTLHPVDLQYIKEMVPNVSSEVVLQLKNLKPGNCIAFGSAFQVPTSMYIDLPNPRPLSNNVDLTNVWYKKADPDTLISPSGISAGSSVGVATMPFTPDVQTVAFVPNSQPTVTSVQPEPVVSVNATNQQQDATESNNNVVSQNRFIQTQPDMLNT